MSRVIGSEPFDDQLGGREQGGRGVADERGNRGGIGEEWLRTFSADDSALQETAVELLNRIFKEGGLTTATRSLSSRNLAYPG